MVFDGEPERVRPERTQRAEHVPTVTFAREDLGLSACLRYQHYLRMRRAVWHCDLIRYISRLGMTQRPAGLGRRR